MKPHQIRKLRVANRSEIAIRIFRAATELSIRTVAVYAYDDCFVLHRFKADEVGSDHGPFQAYLAVDEMIRAAKQAGADTIHPGCGVLLENPYPAEA